MILKNQSLKASGKAMGTPHVLKLPPEMLCQILGYLDLHDMLRCTQASRLFLKAVKDSSRLQYTIELAMRQMVSIPPPPPAQPVGARLRVLRSREHSWKHLSWKGKHKLDLSATGSVYEFVGGVYGNGREDERRVAGAISFFELPSAPVGPAGGICDAPEKTIRKWTHDMGILQVIDFTMDPVQDLLVLVVLAPPDSAYVYHLHLHTLSANTPHPRAPLAVLPSLPRELVLLDQTANLPGPDVTVRVQVSGDLVALLVKEVLDSVGAHLELWNWQAEGEYSVVAARPTGIDDFCFLSHSQLLLVKPSGKLEVCTFEDPRESRRNTVPTTKANYALPELTAGYLYWYISMSSNPAAGYVPKAPSHEGTFSAGNGPTYCPLPDERIHECCLYVFNPSSVGDTNVHAFVFFVNIRTFLQPSSTTPLSPTLSIVSSESSLNSYDDPQAATSTAAPSQSGNHEHTADAVPWEEWGPANTRWFRERVSTDWQHALFGFRTAETVITHSEPLEVNQRRLRVRDFNPYAVRRALTESQGDRVGWRARIVTGPSTTFTGGAYVHDIVSSLPYTEVISKEHFDVTDVMMDECRLLLLKRLPSGELANVDVLTL